MHRVHFAKENVTLWAPEGANLRALALENGIDVYPFLGGKGPASCHGHGLCGKCLVVLEGEQAAASPKGKRETLTLRLWDLLTGPFRPKSRLSCQVSVHGELEVETVPDHGPRWQTHPYYSGRPVHSWESTPSQVEGAP